MKNPINIRWPAFSVLHPPSEDAKQVTSYTESTILAALSEDDLQTIVNEGRVPTRSTYGLPCHNQRVERAIKLVTETSLKAAKKSWSRRDTEYKPLLRLGRNYRSLKQKKKVQNEAKI